MTEQKKGTGRKAAKEAKSSRSYIREFDPHFSIFYELMAFKVREILLLSSPYDAYIMEEDGSLAVKIINEYHGLNLSQPPRITRVSTVEQALGLLEKKHFDLVITMPHLGGIDCNTFGRSVKERCPDLPVILLAHSVQDAAGRPGEGTPCFIDNTYTWCCDSDILLAIVKSVEDRRNVDFDSERAMVRVILLVEDSPGHRSQILPILYSELVKQTQAVLDEGLNEQHRLLKMRARPKILTAETFEQALDLFTRYRHHIFAVLSDVRYPKEGVLVQDAGIQFMEMVRREIRDLPILMLSTDRRNEHEAMSLPAVFAWKNTATLRADVHAFLNNYLGFGDFTFRLPDGAEVARAASMYEFEQCLKTIPDASLLYHARQNHFSNWVMARAEVALAARLHKQHFESVAGAAALREDILFKVHALRRLRQRGVVTRFSRESFDPAVTDFVRIGRGSMGGKGRGIAFVRSQLQQGVPQDSTLHEVAVRVPATCVITTEGFDAFVEHNALQFTEGKSDEEIAGTFLEAAMPSWLQEDLRAYLHKIDYPLSVRSSSMLEDAQFRPYAGLYSTFMLLNSHPDFEVRFQQLLSAVKLVYASTWFEGPRSFSRSVGQENEDSMAVIIQQLAGDYYGGYFYPAISGVIQSYNYYPVPPMQSEDGIASIGLGFGKTVVEGEQSLRFAPAYPENLPQFSSADDILRHSQHWFYSLKADDPAAFSPRDSNLVRRSLDEAKGEYPVHLLSSTYFPEEHRIRDADLPGQKVLTFAPLLKYGFFPLAEVMVELIAMGREGMGCEVEIEFALHLHEDRQRCVFNFLQIRPIVTGSAARDVSISETDWHNAVLVSDRALGHGLYQSMRDIVYVRPERFDRAATTAVAGEIGRLNRSLRKEGRSFLLIGFGRWGTADPWLGIPVQWSDISGVGAMVEVQGCGVTAEPSQGTHFFHNITSLDIPYLMVSESDCTGHAARDKGTGVDWQWLARQKVLQDGKYVRHVRVDQPLVLKVNGHDSRAALLYDDGSTHRQHRKKGT